MRSVRFIFLALVLSLLCCSRAKAPVASHNPARIVLAFHGDTDFNADERAVIQEAIQSLAFQTAGMLDMRVAYDLDFHADGPVPFTGEAWIVKADSSYPWIQIVEQMNGEGKMLGLTIREPLPTSPPQVYLVMDRLQERAKFKHATMHELLHAAGLEHVPAGGSIMSPAVCYMSGGMAVCPNTTCMTPSDAAEFCRVARCKPQELNACEWGG